MLPSFLTPYRTALLGLTLAALAVSCIAPPWPTQFFLQHIPTTLAIILLTWGAHKISLSDRSFTCVIIFLLLHIVGARWIYSYVPYDAWSQWLIGKKISDIFGFRRNHYDRVVHFAYGLLLVYPIREVLEKGAKLRPALAGWFAVELIMGTSMIYELIEWLVAVILSPQWAEAYNGQQGDMWDAQKDMALATAGALAATAVIAVVKKRRKSE